MTGKWLEDRLLEFALRAANAQRECDRIIADFRAGKLTVPADSRDGLQRDHDEEKEGSTR